MRTTLPLALALAVAPAVVTAQDHPLVGSWDVTYAGGFEVRNGVTTVIEVTGTLTVVETPDSLIATLVTPPTEGLPTRPPARFATARTAAWPVRFEQRSPATVEINGRAEERVGVSRWMFTVDGDQLGGTVARGIEGLTSPSDAPRPLTGRRRPPAP